MTSAKFSGFWTPPPPLSAFCSDLQYRIHATSLTASAFGVTPPPPLSADVICTSPLMEQANDKSRGRQWKAVGTHAHFGACTSVGFSNLLDS